MSKHIPQSKCYKWSNNFPKIKYLLVGFDSIKEEHVGGI